ncbi:hypothetical protein C1H46_030159 [Malus baccata]|uniref:Uncharacterized protein n=1 Tax=Malus baccata TaxID=106549 RepID=A0A540LCU6_MALBA|nr:hypothetical protein C1H46_030159 [Malus baccata]
MFNVNYYRFSAWPHPIRTLPPSSNQANEIDILQTGKKVTIEELGYLDPDLYKNDTFLCKVSIKQYSTRYEWWYTASATCAKQMFKEMLMGGVAKFAGEECLNRLGNNPLARSSTIHWTVAEIEKVGLNGFRVGGNGIRNAC